MAELNQLLIKRMQKSYHEKHGEQQPVKSSKQCDAESIFALAGRENGVNTLYEYNGNLLAVYQDLNNNGKTEDGELRYITDKHTLGKRSDVEQIGIQNEANVKSDLVNSTVAVENTKGEISGKNIKLFAGDGSEITQVAKGGQNTAVASGEGTKVIMRDHDPDNKSTAFQSELQAIVSNGAEIIQAGYNENTTNTGAAINGGTLNQQGAYNYAVADGPESFIGQQGSSNVNSKESVAFLDNGATARQFGEDANSNTIAIANNANVHQTNENGLAHVESYGNSMISQDGNNLEISGQGFKGLKQNDNYTTGQGGPGLNNFGEFLQYIMQMLLP